MNEKIKRLIQNTTIELSKIYPEEYAYSSRAVLWAKGLNETTLVTQELYNEAVLYYGKLWLLAD
ncbi:MAG: hypothetical protein K0S61_95 [Anaerocolumna sp.]|jgi:hypothetical protein|nr:hypothetical protein [Anaerocolumna sp.]